MDSPPRTPQTLRERWRASEPTASDHRPCRSCGTTVVWTITTALSKMPVDVAPSEDGNVALMEPRYHGHLRSIVLGPLDTLTHDAPLRKSHFATCPNAGEWRKK